MQPEDSLLYFYIVRVMKYKENCGNLLRNKIIRMFKEQRFFLGTCISGIFDENTKNNPSLGKNVNYKQFRYVKLNIYFRLCFYNFLVYC